MYHLYHTPAFVLGSAPFGEANKQFTLLTREFGMITASATSVRKERSKLRYGLQDFSYSEVTLVRGKEMWRLTQATLIENLHTAFRATPDAVRMFAQVFRLIRRLVAGEEKHEELFTAVYEAFSFLNAIRTTNRIRKYESNHPAFGPPPSKGGEAEGGRNFYSAAEVEIVLVLRILYLLGYLAPREEFSAALADLSLWNGTLLAEARAFRTLALSEINHSLKATQL